VLFRIPESTPGSPDTQSYWRFGYSNAGYLAGPPDYRNKYIVELIIGNTIQSFGFTAGSPGTVTPQAGDILEVRLAENDGVNCWLNRGGTLTYIFGTGDIRLGTAFLHGLAADATGGAEWGDIRWIPGGMSASEHIRPLHTLVPASGTATGDLSKWRDFTLTLTGNTTLAVSNTPAATFGATWISARFTQDGTGGRTLTLPGSFKVTGSLDTAANAVTTLVAVTFDGGTSWQGTLTEGFA
jgi:hypothetical protein